MKHRVLILAISLTLGSPVLAATKIPHLNSVDLIWETDAYTPPFYLGHTLAVPEGLVRVVAVPDIENSAGTKIGLGDLNFEWQKDDYQIGTASGLGKNTLIFNMSNDGKASTVNVTVSSRDQKIKLDKQLTIGSSKPKLVFYENDPLTGTNYDQALITSFNLVKPELDLVAEPFFFSRSDFSGGKINYDWRLNDQKIISDPSDQRNITLAAPPNVSGSNNLTVSASNNGKILQNATNALVVKFNQHDVNF